MELKQNLNIKPELKQQLILTPETKLSLEILQATYLELEDILNQELINNPIIEDIKIVKPEPKEKAEDFDEENKMNEDEEDTFKTLDKPEYEVNEDYEKAREYYYNSIQQIEQETLESHLIERLNEIPIEDEEIYLAAKAIIYELDDNGFLSITTDEIAKEINIPREKVEKALEVVQNINDPPGIAARNIRENLLLQLKYKNLKDTLAYKIVESSFDLLEKKQYEKLANFYKVTIDDIKKAEEIIKDCDLFPGKTFKPPEKPLYIVPDIIVKEEDGKLNIDIMGSQVDIIINESFLEEYKKNPKTKEFAEECQKKAKDLKRSLDKRNETIQKIVELIIKIQKEYILNPEKGLKPLTLKEIADAIGVHESTVSRTVSKKYIQLPHGVYPLRIFFSQRLHTDFGDISNKIVMDKIKDLIENENSEEPLTDTKITEILNEQGIKLSRRTVTKYREQLGIMPVNMRKNIKNN